MAKHKITLHVVGTKPGILMNAPAPDLLERLINKNPKPKSTGGDIDLNDLAKGKLYLDDDGSVVIPGDNLLAALKYAGRSVKIGRKAVSTATSTTLFSLIELDDMYLKLDGGKPGTEPIWKLDLRRGVHRQGSSEVMVALPRPLFKEWGFTATVYYDDKVVSVEVIRQLFDIAGSNSGLCDFRPSRGGRFGRFVVDSWVIEKVEEKKLAAATV